jgi:16S rRNA (guanine966-N2)-methyltransferase
MSGRAPGVVRIVAGAKRGLRIGVPAGAEVRPTSEKVREAIFDVLGPVGGLRVLDLFAGTGALGLEALSRGAQACTFVECDPRVASGLRANIELLQYDRICRVVAADYRKAASGLERTAQNFDLLFVDPPYRMLTEVEAALTPLVRRLLSLEGVMVIEGPRSMSATFGQSLVFERDYGDTKITMVRQKE